MTFANFQQRLKKDWDNWKQRKHPVSPTHQRKQHLCPKCGKQGYRVKMDYLGNQHVQYQMTCYNMDHYKCPRCSHLEKEWSRIEGRGKTGTNLGEMYGSK